MAAPMSCTSQSVFCCILRNFAFAGKSVTPPTDHGSMSRLMFGLTKATMPPRKMRERMRHQQRTNNLRGRSCSSYTSLGVV